MRKITSTANISSSVSGVNPRAIAVDSAGNIFIAQDALNTVIKVDPVGNRTTIAGTGVAGFSGDGGPATSAQLNAPRGVAVDLAGNLYISDNNNYRIRRVTAASPQPNAGESATSERSESVAAGILTAFGSGYALAADGL